MRSGSHAIWQVCGSPRVDDCEDTLGARCWVCAGPADRSAERESWMGSSFVGQNKVRCPESSRVCEPCLFVMSRTSPVPGRPPAPGKKFGGNFRNYSHLWEAGGYYENASKGEKPRIREFLRRHHASDWFAAIADSGQKHVVPWVPINPPGRIGLVLFDETIVRFGPSTIGLVEATASLLTAGATKDEIASGAYSPFTWMRCPDAVRQYEGQFGPMRGAAEFALAIWLAQRDEEKVAARLEAERAERAEKSEAPAKRAKRSKQSTRTKETKRGPEQGRQVPAGRPDSGADAVDTERVPRIGGESPNALGAVAHADEARLADDEQHAAVHHEDLRRPPSRCPAQLDLFGHRAPVGGHR